MAIIVQPPVGGGGGGGGDPGSSTPPAPSGWTQVRAVRYLVFQHGHISNMMVIPDVPQTGSVKYRIRIVDGNWASDHFHLKAVRGLVLGLR